MRGREQGEAGLVRTMNGQAGDLNVDDLHGDRQLLLQLLMVEALCYTNFALCTQCGAVGGGKLHCCAAEEFALSRLVCFPNVLDSLVDLLHLLKLVLCATKEKYGEYTNAPLSRHV